MKKLFGSLIFAILFAFLLTPIPEAQAQDKITKGFSVSEYLGTAANGSQKNAYLDLRDWETVDSVGFSFSCTGEIDIDTVNFYPGNYTFKGFKPDAAAGVLYQACAIDLAAGVSDGLVLQVTSNATKLTGAALRGANGIKAVIEIQNTSGNDATDPNELNVNWRIYGTRRSN